MRLAHKHLSCLISFNVKHYWKSSGIDYVLASTAFLKQVEQHQILPVFLSLWCLQSAALQHQMICVWGVWSTWVVLYY